MLESGRHGESPLPDPNRDDSLGKSSGLEQSVVARALAGHTEYVTRYLAQARERDRLSNSEAQEFSRLFLDELPDFKTSGMPLEQYASFVWETTQLATACISREPAVKTQLVNILVQRALESAGEPARGFVIDPITDQVRGGAERSRGTFGQVTDVGDKRTSFIGYWPAKREVDGAVTERANAGFKISATGLIAEAVVVTVPESDPRYFRHLARLENRGANAWRTQTSPGTSVDDWIVRVAGNHKIGQREGYDSLGVYSEAVKDALEEMGVTNFLLPRSRREGPSKPWHSARFLEPIVDEGKMIWRGYAFRDNAGERELVHITLPIAIEAEIKLFRRVPK
ncbi:MAG: hypothetical protein KDD70_10845 [Bdellovibrionales bacterium]|nr:hypothetical protein [Bdellovibrionales bacterium]